MILEGNAKFLPAFCHESNGSQFLYALFFYGRHNLLLYVMMTCC